MIENKTKNKFISGYLKLNSELSILEFGGKADSLFTKNLTEGVNLIDAVSGFEISVQKKIFDCLQTAVKMNIVKVCSLEHNYSDYQLTITPLTKGEVIFSFLTNTPDDFTEYKWITNRLPGIIIRFNNKAQQTYISPNITQLTNLPPQNLIGKRPTETKYLEEYSSDLENIILNVFKAGESISNEVKLTTKNKKSRWLKLNISPEFNEKDVVGSVVCYIQDISDTKIKELELEDRNKRLQYLIEASNTGVWDWIIGSDNVYYSRKWKAQLGYYHDEIADNFETWERLLHPDDRDRMMRELQNFIKSDLFVFEAEFRMRHKNGNYIWIRNRASCIRGNNNKAIRLLGTHLDISTEKKLEGELQLFKQSAQNSSASIIITDLEGYIEYFNPAFCKISNWDADEIIGKKPKILKSGFHTPDFYTKLWKTISDGNVWQGEMKNKKKNGRYYWELATIAPIKNPRGIVTHFVKISEDISQLKKLANELRTLRRSAEVANIYKNNFLANMSHKIRTPINGIIGFSDLLKNGTPNKDQQEQYLNIIEQNSNSLLHLIDHIIDAARIEADEMKIKKESCSLKDLFIELKPIANKISEAQSKQSINIKWITPKETHHDIIFTDPIRLKQILHILFENSLKQTEEGFIEIGYQIYSERKLQFYVQDSGVGFKNDQLDILTHQFKVNERNISQMKGGMGLGLSICRGLVRLLGGQIGLKSKKGKGSIFYFTIPYDKIKVQTRKSIIEKSKDSKYDFSKHTILIAEDVSYNFEYLKNIFASTGAKLLWAKDGIDVLNIFNNNEVDLILMDIQLPEISGFEATRQIRKKNTKIPIIAQTGFTMDEDRERCLAAGCNDVLIKPLKIQEVLKVVSNYLLA